MQPEGEATSDKLFTTGDGYRSVLAGVYEAMASRNLYGVELQFWIGGLYVTAIYLGLEIWRGGD